VPGIGPTDSIPDAVHYAGAVLQVGFVVPVVVVERVGIMPHDQH